MSRKCNLRFNQKGVSLFDTIIALTMLSFVFTFSMAALNNSLKRIEEVSIQMKAACLLNQRMEEIRTLGFDGLKNYPSLREIAVLNQGEERVQVEDYSEGIKKISVSLQWSLNGRKRELSAVTLIARRKAE